MHTGSRKQANILIPQPSHDIGYHWDEEFMHNAGLWDIMRLVRPKRKLVNAALVVKLMALQPVVRFCFIEGAGRTRYRDK